jgi:hypothetical protein
MIWVIGCQILKSGKTYGSQIYHPMLNYYSSISLKIVTMQVFLK